MKTINITSTILLAITLLASTARTQILVPKWNNTTITLGSGNNGLGYSPVTGNVLASVCASGTAGNATIYRLKSADGTSAGVNLTVNSTITGGTYVIGGLAVGSDGVIYACNYAAEGAAKIYSWANESATPAQLGSTFTVGLGGTGNLGKNLTVYGTGNNAVFLLTGTTTNALYVYYDTGTSTWKAKILVVGTGTCVTSLAFVNWTPTSCTFLSKNSSASGYQGVFNPSSTSPISVTQTAITGWPTGSGTIQNVAYDPATQLAGTFTRNSASPWTITVNTWETGIPAGTTTAPVAQTPQTANASGTDGGAAGDCCWGDGVYFCMPAVGGFGARAFDITAFRVTDITPTTQTKNIGDSATFAVVSGGSALSYVWQRNGSPITNGGDFANATTASLTVSPIAAADAGTYTCTVSGVSSSSWSSGNGLLAVSLPATTNSLALTAGSNPSTYGDSLTFTATISSSGGVTPSGSVIFKDSLTPIWTNTLIGSGSTAASTFVMGNFSAGSHSITAVYAGDANYAASTSSVLGQTVNPLTVTLTGSRAYDGTNDAAAAILTITTNYDGTNLTLSGSAALAGSSVGLQNIFSFAGLILGGTAASNYTLTGASGAVTIGVAPLSVTAGAQVKTYGQTVLFAGGSSQFASSGLQSGDTIGSVTLTCGGGASNAPVSGSPYTITPSVATGGTFDAANYTITYHTDNLTVNPLAVILTGAQTYNGTTNVTNSTLSVANAIGSDDVNVASGGVTMASEDIGTNALALPGTLALGGTMADNYTLTGASGSVVVTPLAVVLTGTRPYDGTATAASTILSVSDKVGSDDVSVASGTATLAGAAVGQETIASVGSLALGGTMAGDYTLTGATGSVTISNPHAPFSVTSCCVDATGSNFIIVWDSVPGVTYHVMTSSDLIAWTNACSPVIATTEITTNVFPIGNVTAQSFFDIFAE